MPSGVYQRKTIEPIVRFNQKYDVLESGCWQWNACKTSDGYPWFSFQSTAVLAHRWSYEYHIGKIPEGKVIDHLCRNPSCVNPKHMQCTSMKVNTEKGVLYELRAIRAKNKTHCKRGHPLFGDNLFVDHRGDRCCKECRRMKSREWKAKNQEHVNALQRIRRANANSQQLGVNHV